MMEKGKFDFRKFNEKAEEFSESFFPALLYLIRRKKKDIYLIYDEDCQVQAVSIAEPFSNKIFEEARDKNNTIAVLKAI